MLAGRKSKQIDIKDKCLDTWHSKEGEKYGTTIFLAKNIIPLFLLLNDKYQELQSACDALGMPLDHINHIHQSM